MSTALHIEGRLGVPAEQTLGEQTQLFLTKNVPIQGKTSLKPERRLYFKSETWEGTGSNQAQYTRLALHVNSDGFAATQVPIDETKPIMYASLDSKGVITHLEIPTGTEENQQIVNIALHKSVIAPDRIVTALRLLPIIQRSGDPQALLLLTHLLSPTERSGLSRRDFLHISTAGIAGFSLRALIKEAQAYITPNQSLGGPNSAAISRVPPLKFAYSLTDTPGTLNILPEQVDAKWIGKEQISPEEGLSAFEFTPLYPDGIDPYVIDVYGNYAMLNGSIVSPKLVRDSDLLLGSTPQVELWGRDMQLTTGISNQETSHLMKTGTELGRRNLSSKGLLSQADYQFIKYSLEGTYRTENIDTNTVPLITKVRELTLAINSSFPNKDGVNPEGDYWERVNRGDIDRLEQNILVAAALFDIYEIKTNLFTFKSSRRNSQGSIQVKQEAAVAFTHNDRAYVADPARPLMILPLPRYLKEVYVDHAFRIQPEVSFWSIFSTVTPAGEYLPWNDPNWVNDPSRS